MPAVHFDSYTEGRQNFRQLIDAASRGHAASVRRNAQKVAVVDVARLRHYLTVANPHRAQVVAEGGGWSIFLPGLPIAADGDTLDEAIEDMIAALREYVEDWHDHLSEAPNHMNNWGLVQLVTFSTDEQLRAWLVGEPDEAGA